MRVGLNEESLAEWQAKDLEHLRYEYELSSDDLVIDIGAYRGEWAREIFERYGCKLICVDPTPSIVGFELGQVINKAASDHDGRISFGGAYYYTSAFEELNHEYECFDINALLERYERIALCKINIEGDEYSLLQRMFFGGHHERVTDFQIQFHTIEGEPYEDWYAESAAKLSETHHLTFRYRYCWENWRLNA